jgi:hypothetical protein
MGEHAVQNAIRLAAGRVAKLFRNNTGQAWTGREVVRMKNGDVLIKEPRPFRAGLCVGSSDLIGWRTVTVTPDMVGRPVALFTALEVKGPRGRGTPEQLHFIQAVLAAGGLAGIVKTPAEALTALGHEDPA